MGAVKALAQVKRVVRRCAAELYALSPRYLHVLRGKVAILTYHRVVSNHELESQDIQPGMYVTAETFAAQMQFLKRHFAVIPFAELLQRWADKEWSADQRYCVVTFDDGWLDNYLYAFPVLKRFKLPATVFLPTTFIGTEKWFWPEQIAWVCRQSANRNESERRRIVGMFQKESPWLARLETVLRAHDTNGIIEGCKSLNQEQIDSFVATWAAQLGIVLPRDRQVINWGEAQEMSAAGISFGSHSATHRILTNLAPADLRQEVEGSWAALKQRPITTVPVFCYPNGDWSAEVGRCVEAAGYAAATTTMFGYEDRVPSMQFGLKRIHIHNDITFNDTLFAFHLAGYNHAR